MLNSLMLLMGGGVEIAAPFLASYGGSGDELAYSVAFDPDGNVIVAGITTSTGKIGTQDGFILKISPSGALEWARVYGAATFATSFFDVAVDSSGNIHVCGNSDEPGYGSTDCIVLKVSGVDGSITWQRELGSANAETLYSIAVDSSGNVASTGITNNDILTAYWNSSGTLQWQRTLAGSAGSNETGLDIVFDSAGAVVLSGAIQTASGLTAVTAKYNSSGTLQWQRNLTNGTNQTYAIGVALDSSNNVHTLVGDTGANEITIVKMNSSAGSITWQRDFAVTSYSHSSNPARADMAVDSSGNVFSLFPATITTVSAIIAQHNSSGTIQWQNRLRDDNVTDAIQPFGLAYNAVTGFVVSVSATAAIGAGSNDGLITHFRADGTGTGTRNTIEYEAAGLTEAAGGLTVGAGSATGATSTLTSGTSGLSSASISLTLTVS